MRNLAHFLCCQKAVSVQITGHQERCAAILLRPRLFPNQPPLWAQTELAQSLAYIRSAELPLSVLQSQQSRRA